MSSPHRALQCRFRVADNIIVHSNTASPVLAAAPKAGSIRIPFAVLEHLPDLHGAEFKVLLVLGRNQARGGGRDHKPFSCSIPQIMEDTGLCPRAISQAISRLDKHHLILCVPKHGALPNSLPGAPGAGGAEEDCEGEEAGAGVQTSGAYPGRQSQRAKAGGASAEADRRAAAQRCGSTVAVRTDNPHLGLPMDDNQPDQA